jgi:biofilm PGA synthesis protein PgaA
MKHRIDFRNGACRRYALIAIPAVLLWGGMVGAVFSASPVVSQRPAAASAEKVMQKVRACVRRNDFQRALALLAPYAERPAAFPTLYSDYLVILIWAGDPSAAVRRFEALPPSFPRRPYLLRNMAKAYYDQGHFSKAAALYQATCAFDPKDRIARQGWVAALMAGGQYERAEQVLAKAADGGNGSLQLNLLKARAALYRAHFVQALERYDALMASRPAHRAMIAKARDDLIAGLPSDRQARLLAALKAEVESPHTDDRVAQYYALCLTLAHKYGTAADYLDSISLDSGRVPDDRLYWFAWADFKAGRSKRALEEFNTLLARDPQDTRARIGKIYCFAALADYRSARDEIAAVKTTSGQEAEWLYARAYVCERQARFWDAVRIYDHLLERMPDDRTAMRLRLLALADMGAISVAARQAERLLPPDEQLLDIFRQDAARDRIHWQENRQAVRQLAALAESDSRYALDYVIALSKAERYVQAIAVYERLTASGVAPSDTACLAAADAYLSEQRPERALALYNQVLTHQPALEEARMGKFYALQTLRRWKEADAWLDRMDADIPAVITVAGRSRPNPGKFELAVVRAWYLAHQNRLAEAESAFHALQAEAPANLEVRNGLAHIYLWRGWPRQALQAFDILNTLVPLYKPAQSGRAMALNDLAEKAQARAVATGLLERDPRDKHAQEIERTLQVEQMREWRTEIDAEGDDDHSYDTRIRTEVSAPLALKTRLFGYLLWRRTWNEGTSSDTDGPAYFRRVGLGLDHIVDAAWRIRPSVSANYNDGKDAGAALRVDYSPTDHWTFGAYGDSFSTEVAGRARAAGIEAALFGADAVWRSSEARQAGMGFTRSLFSDDNVRDEFSMGYEQNVWARHDWRMRVYLNLYATWNSKGDQTVYFNPEQAWELSLTYMTEQTVWQMYKRSFVHRLFVTVGTYAQKGYGSDFVGSLRYEQEHAFNDRNALKAGISIGRNVYDGDAVSDIRLDMVYQWRF